MIGFLLAAKSSGLGLGFVLGEPTGLSLKLWQPQRSPSYVFVFGVEGPSHFHFHADFVWHFPLSSAQDLDFLLYLGPSVEVEEVGPRDDERLAVGPRFVLGPELLFRQVPLDLFFDFAVGFHVVPDFDEDLDFGVGLRFNLI